jgi:hypothetical protein
MPGSILAQSGTKEMQVICTKCFEDSDPPFETESIKNLFQSFPDPLMILLHLPGKREDAI